ncbi:uncharacterized protein CIMG_13718 [Coccidioides immitis RS]|uniref:Uncharacterized protein n=1 Tax=Coccidioides immitis (strain RS) TaxID=246410 RepID=A0A0D8JWJ6_COCIM|nr:uncharacterized protein CIMG_13718 [Coccidioides immitis RS]KJF61514.1 hypothetical protein CIMG_13718 [Coccidioides immitis RS]
MRLCFKCQKYGLSEIHRKSPKNRGRFARKKDAPRRRQDGARSSHMREDAVDIYNGTTYKMPQRSPARLPTSIGRSMKMRAKMPSESRGRLVKCALVLSCITKVLPPCDSHIDAPVAILGQIWQSLNPRVRRKFFTSVAGSLESMRTTAMHIRGPLDQLEQLVHTIHSDCTGGALVYCTQLGRRGRVFTFAQ